MEDLVMVDSCLFIDHFRSKNKNISPLEMLSKRCRRLCVSSVSKYEVLCGISEKDSLFWLEVLEEIEVFPFDDATVSAACRIFRQLKRESCLLDLGDILIAATAIAHDLPLATLNRRHFERIEGLKLT